MGSPPEPAPRRRRVHREESEVTSWPRGLVGYVPERTDDAGPPDEEEDRLAQRIRLAARLIDLLRAQGIESAEWPRELARAERAYRAHDRPNAHAAIEGLIGALGTAAERVPR